MVQAQGQAEYLKMCAGFGRMSVAAKAANPWNREGGFEVGDGVRFSAGNDALTLSAPQSFHSISTFDQNECQREQQQARRVACQDFVATTRPTLDEQASVRFSAKDVDSFHSEAKSKPNASRSLDSPGDEKAASHNSSSSRQPPGASDQSCSTSVQAQALKEVSQNPDPSIQLVAAVGLSTGRNWVLLALYYLNDDLDDLSDVYRTLVRRWIGIEIGREESSQGFPSNTLRPVEVDKWLKKKVESRFTCRTAPVLDQAFAHDFPPKFRAWWDSLQPASRRPVPEGTPDPSRADNIPLRKLKSLDKWGVRGWVVLLVCIKWYGLSILTLQDGERDVAKTGWNLLAGDALKFVYDNLFVPSEDDGFELYLPELSSDLSHRPLPDASVTGRRVPEPSHFSPSPPNSRHVPYSSLNASGTITFLIAKEYASDASNSSNETTFNPPRPASSLDAADPTGATLDSPAVSGLRACSESVSSSFTSSDSRSSPSHPLSGKAKEDYVPRPPNAFILYRSHFWEVQKSNPTERNHRQISRSAGIKWQSLSEEEKDPWRKLAERRKQEHAEKYPEYKFSPQRKARSVRHAPKRVTEAKHILLCSECGSENITKRSQKALGKR
ncbi:hypothetical protein V5O48_002449 [Marasmius crinis-equi]|uniref:HMG box domain-containing protein n=1 Tax=Marasmius crinis-equi TaxID=585013 RepID=A0ABR3FVL3_9AGAR